MPRVFFTAAARSDLEDDLAWYEAQAPEIVPRFREALRVAVSRLGENPKQFPSSSHRTRRAPLRHFPYLLIFRETRAAVYVVAVFHTSRDPKVWQNRTS
ncbi:type II toxin-antitoxin system RelE/ParE family toxin [Bradyrhizobium ontarionense]|uniref:Type II toxin-antitoxin system RelE/ParE family toxin n=1 Tax=Bradyrhizobium ontarionense TaxID=2898149 RepID=A0ABY3R6K7_9BRAD|nr:type II toxin-antitoxin system RelE/ParE family toxin [Bradyrhizobium sp. A19]UFZ02965.1 type II toxin-antitoxin system RelE/ParE family toxin [Bradyrhizobium sp. A19]